MDQTASNSHPEAAGGGPNPAGAPSPAIVAARRAEATLPVPGPSADGPDGLGNRPEPERSGWSPVALALFLVLGVALGVGAVFGLLVVGDDDSTSQAADLTSDDPDPTQPASATPSTIDPDSAAEATAVSGTPTSAPADNASAPRPESDSNSASEQASSTLAPGVESGDGGGDGSAQRAEGSVECRINLLAQTIDAGAVTCDGGAVEITGDTDRWHNDIRTVFLSDGVESTVYFEPRADGTFDGQAVVELTPGSNRLNPTDAAFGISLLIVEFTGGEQHIHLNGDGRGELTATFRDG